MEVSTSAYSALDRPGSIVSTLMYICQDVAVHSGPSRIRRLPDIPVGIQHKRYFSSTELTEIVSLMRHIISGCL